MVCYLCLQHHDHNVVSSSLETLEILLKHSQLFDLDQLFLLTKVHPSIGETRVSQTLKTGRPEQPSMNVYFIWTHPLSYPHLSTFIHRLYWPASAVRGPKHWRARGECNGERRTTNISGQIGWTTDFEVARSTSKSSSFSMRLIRYILNIDGAIKGDDASRVSIKCATLTCLAHLSTIDPFAFFDSFDYPSESRFSPISQATVRLNIPWWLLCCARHELVSRELIDIVQEAPEMLTFTQTSLLVFCKWNIHACYYLTRSWKHLIFSFSYHLSPITART